MVPLGRVVGGALAAVLVSAMVGFIPSAAGEVATSPGLSVDPPTGDAGTQVVATATGYDNCSPSADSSDDAGFGAVIFRWEESDQTWTADVEEPGAATQTITVPAAFGPGPHDLVAWCASDDAQRSTDTFTVSSPELPEELELELQPATGPAGTEVQATATGYDSCFPSFDDVGLGTVIFRWEEDDQTWTDDVEEPGTATHDRHGPRRASGPAPTTWWRGARATTPNDPLTRSPCRT